MGHGGEDRRGEPAGGPSPQSINLAGEVTLPQGLPSGYWRFVTKTGLDAADEGEALVAVTPRLPAQTPWDWPAGNHTGPDEIDSSFGTPGSACTTATTPRAGGASSREGEMDLGRLRRRDRRLSPGRFPRAGVLEGVPAWRTKSGKFAHSALEYPDRDFADWKNYVRTIVAHYKGVIDVWEVTNEPVFAGKSFDGQENPLWYTEILKHAYQAAKEIDHRSSSWAGPAADRWKKTISGPRSRSEPACFPIAMCSATTATAARGRSS